MRTELINRANLFQRIDVASLLQGAFRPPYFVLEHMHFQTISLWYLLDFISLLCFASTVIFQTKHAVELVWIVLSSYCMCAYREVLIFYSSSIKIVPSPPHMWFRRWNELFLFYGNYNMCVSENRFVFLGTFDKNKLSSPFLSKPRKCIATFCRWDIVPENRSMITQIFYFLLQHCKDSVWDFFMDMEKQLFANSFQFPCIQCNLWLFLPVFVIAISIVLLLCMTRKCYKTRTRIFCAISLASVLTQMQIIPQKQTSENVDETSSMNSQVLVRMFFTYAYTVR